MCYESGVTLIDLASWRREHKPAEPAASPPNRTLTSAGILPSDGEATASAHGSALKNAMHRLDACKLESDQPETGASEPSTDETESSKTKPDPV